MLDADFSQQSGSLRPEQGKAKIWPSAFCLDVAVARKAQRSRENMDSPADEVGL